LVTNDKNLKKHQVKTADKRLRDKPSLGLGLGLGLGPRVRVSAVNNPYAKNPRLDLRLGLVPRALGLGLGLESIQGLLLQPFRVT